MKLILKDQDERLDAALATLAAKMASAAEAQDAALVAARAAMQQSLDDVAAAMHAFTAEGAAIIEATRAATAAKTAEYFGDAEPKLPVSNVPVFQLVIPGEGDKLRGSLRGYSALAGMAERIITDAGIVVTDKAPESIAPEISVHITELEEIAKANHLDLAIARDAIKAIGYAWARKSAGIDAAREAAIEAAIEAPREAAE